MEYCGNYYFEEDGRKEEDFNDGDECCMICGKSFYYKDEYVYGGYDYQKQCDCDGYDYIYKYGVDVDLDKEGDKILAFSYELDFVKDYLWGHSSRIERIRGMVCDISEKLKLTFYEIYHDGRVTHFVKELRRMVFFESLEKSKEENLKDYMYGH